MHITADDLVDALRSQDLRITEPRRLVCEIIARRHGDHLTASAIYEAVSSGSSGSVDRATVYRTLDALEEAGAVRHSHLGNGPTVYHLAEEAGHHHLVCTECGRTVSVRSETIAPLIGTLEEATVEADEAFAAMLERAQGWARAELDHVFEEEDKVLERLREQARLAGEENASKERLGDLLISLIAVVQAKSGRGG